MTGIRLPRVLRPFAIGQFRILVAALAISILGTGMWLVGIVFQVRELGGGPIELSFVAAANAIGLVVTVLFGGVAADRLPQKFILVGVEVLKGAAVAVVGVLAITGVVEVWHLALVSFVLGVADGFFFPAYSALLPSVLPADDLLAANGLEGVLRPAVMQAAGPVLASAIIAVHSPALVFVVIAGSQVLAILGLLLLRRTPVRRDLSESTPGVRGLLADVAGGFSYMVRTPWLLGTLLCSTVLVLAVVGPMEVLIPFAVTDQTGGGPAEFALVLAGFGIGGVVGSVLVASLPLPRRYLTIMLTLWGLGSLPLALMGITSQLWVMVAAAFAVGFTFQAATVIWGTLLQRRVPPALLGRVSSLDFFVSLAFMPISMALAGPIGEAVGLAPTFLVAGIVPVFLTTAAIILARMPRDEIAHPLDATPPADQEASSTSS